MRPVCLFAIPCLLLAAAAPAAASDDVRILTFEGRSKVDIAGLWQETDPHQRVTVELTRVGPERWRLHYADGEYTCTLEGSGPERAIVIRPKQTCRASCATAELKGHGTAQVTSGTLSVGPEGAGRFEIRATGRGQVRRWISTEVFGRQYSAWSPAMSPSGTVEYAGRQVAAL